MSAPKTESRQLTAGIDPGAGAVKVVLVRSRSSDDPEVLARSSQRIRRRNVYDVVQATFEQACAEAGLAGDPEAFDYVASTGDGDAVELRTGHFYSMTTHARGAVLLEPEARACVDIGALHTRAIRMDERGKVLGHRMTSQCAAGSGQFVENIARYLGVPLEDVGARSVEARAPESCSSICAVLAETDVINMVSRGIATEDILKGIHLSIAGRLVKLLRAVGAEGRVLLTGGMAMDQGLVAAVHETLAEDTRAVGLDVGSHPDSIYAGALGAALLGAFRYTQLKEAGRLVA